MIEGADAVASPENVQAELEREASADDRGTAGSHVSPGGGER